MAGSGNARAGDIATGICPAHKHPQHYSAVITGVSPTVVLESAGASFIGSVAIASCGHPVVVISGSGTVLVNGAGAGRIGDIGTNPGPCVIQTGAQTVISG